MSTSSPNYGDIVVGSRGWLHSTWSQSYYPDDIPDEWRMGFYGNEFNTLLVKWEEWGKRLDSEWLEQLEDLDEDFHLYLELPGEVQALPQGLTEVGAQLVGLVCVDGDADAWQAKLGDMGLPYLARVSKPDLPFQCYAKQGGDDICLALFDTTEHKIEDLLGMREIIEQALPLVESNEQLDFILVDKEPAIESMRNTATIAELLGA